MKNIGKYPGKGLTLRKGLLALFAVLALALLIAAACGEAATATPEAMPDEPTAMADEPTAMADEPTAMADEPTAMADEPTAMPVPTAMTEAGMRLRSEWTVDNPATREEIEAELVKYRGRSIVFSSWGGAYQSAQRQAYGVPFAEQFGIEIIDDSQPTVGRVRAMQESGNVAWHVFDAGGGSIHALANGGSLEELDFSIIDTRDFLEVLKAPYIGGGGITWSETWAYNTDIYPEGSQPQNMADIYDTEKFPGRRSWNQFPDAEIVFVLLAENPDLINSAEGRASLSAPNEEQVDRAFELFEEYRDQPNIFWTTGSDCPQFLLSGEADLCTNWNGRIYDATKEGAPLKICWECGHVLNTDGWGIIKGLKEQDPEAFELAQLYMAWTSFPEINARMSQFITYGPVNSKSLPYLSEPEYDAVRDELPSAIANIPYAIFKDEVHVGERADVWRERWIEYQQTFEN
jgi:putative spermidine/putrescine transport system substrate-binding protein